MKKESIQNRLAYRNLFNNWLDSKDQGMPSGYAPIRSDQATFLKPNNATEFLNAFDPIDLYNHPDKTPNETPYSEPAFNTDSSRVLGSRKPNTTVFISGESNRQPYHSFQDDIPNGIQQSIAQRIPQGIYSHEYAHSKEPRMNPESMRYIPTVNPNHGYVGMDNLNSGTYSAELPAMEAENRYWRGPIINRKRKSK